MQLSWKLRFFAKFFVATLETALNFEHLYKKHDHHTYFISEITEYQRLD